MVWREISPGLYSRPLGGVEAAQVSLIATARETHRELIKIHCLAHFTAPYPIDQVRLAFRTAWRALRLLKSPDIATSFKNGHTEYKVPSSEELEAWLKQTFIVAEIDSALDSTISDTYNHQQWLPTLHLLPETFQPDSFKGTLVLLVSHWRTEAGGAFKILNQLFEYASDVLNSASNATLDALSAHIPGNETALLTPCIEEILMPSQPSEPSTSSSKARLDAHMRNYTSHLPCIPFPSSKPITSPSTTMRRLQRIYTSTSTTSLLQACKSHFLSVTSVIHASYLLAIYALSPPHHRSRNYASMMPTQTRLRLSQNSPFRNQGCWASAQMLWLTSTPPNSAPAPLKTATPQTFLALANHLLSQYRLADSPTWLFEDAREIVSRTLHPSGETPPDSEVIAMPWFTSIGLLDGATRTLVSQHKAGLEIEEVTVWADNPGPGVVFGQWGFRGRLNLQMHWNDAYQSEKDIRVVMDMLETAIREGLGVEMTKERDRGMGEVY